MQTLTLLTGHKISILALGNVAFVAVVVAEAADDDDFYYVADSDFFVADDVTVTVAQHF